MEFKDQYKHPLWQKRRLEALERADFCCEGCTDCDSPLHVHHRQYFKGRKIWEYADDELEVLCDSCHQEAHHLLDELKPLIATLPTHALREIASLIAGYRTEADGSASMEKGYQRHYTGDPHSFKVGCLAASAKRLNVSILDELTREIERTSKGGMIELSIPHKPAHGGFE